MNEKTPFVFDSLEGRFKKVNPSDLPNYSGIPFAVYEERIDSYRNRKACYSLYSPNGDEIVTIYGMLGSKKSVKEFEAKIQKLVNEVQRMIGGNVPD